MAGMRVWPDEMHLGTFYGWIKPIEKLSHHKKVSLLVANRQSLENFTNIEQCDEKAYSLSALLGHFLPTASVFLESELPAFEISTFQALSLFDGKYFGRLGPFSHHSAPDRQISFLKAIYPAMMVANILAIRPDFVLAKRGFQSPHVDVINDVIRRGRNRFGWRLKNVGIWGKEDIFIPDLKGEKHMRRSVPDLSIPVTPDTKVDSLVSMFRKVAVPNYQGPEAMASCKVIAPIWRAVAGETGELPVNFCKPQASGCESCIDMLAIRISEHLRPRSL